MVRGVRAPDGALSLRIRLPALLIALLLLAAAWPALVAPAEAAPRYTALYAFGDSMSDTGDAWIGSGYASPPSLPYMGGRFSNGPVWVENLAHALGLALPAARLAGGTGYAYGGARATGDSVHLNNLPGQLAMFSADVAGVAPAGALYTLSIGSNDLRASVASGLTGAALSAAARQTAQNAAAAVAQLVAMGARHVLVANVSNLGRMPRAQALPPAQRAAQTQAAQVFNTALAAALPALAASTGASIAVLDTFALMERIVADPAALGFSNVTQACWSRGAVCGARRAGQNGYLFWDGGHPTAHGHAVVAAQALTQLP